MKFQKASEFASQIPTGSRNRAEVVLRNMHVAAGSILQLLAQNFAQLTARDCGNFEIFLSLLPFVLLTHSTGDFNNCRLKFQMDHEMDKMKIISRERKKNA